MIQIKNNQNLYQKQVVNVLQRYEDKSNELYKDVKEEGGNSVLNDNEFITNLQQTIQKLSNPYTHIFYWVKGEI